MDNFINKINFYSVVTAEMREHFRCLRKSSVRTLEPPRPAAELQKRRQNASKNWIFSGEKAGIEERKMNYRLEMEKRLKKGEKRGRSDPKRLRTARLISRLVELSLAVQVSVFSRF